MDAAPDLQVFEPQPPGHGTILGMTHIEEGLLVIRAPYGLETGGVYLLRPNALEWEAITLH